jgi:hypothetical protein
MAKLLTLVQLRDIQTKAQGTPLEREVALLLADLRHLKDQLSLARMQIQDIQDGFDEHECTPPEYFLPELVAAVTDPDLVCLAWHGESRTDHQVRALERIYLEGS